MKKIKKIFASFFVFVIGYISKSFAVSASKFEAKYGVFEPEPEPTIQEKIFSFDKIVAPIILFIIGILVILNKKLSNVAKAIVITCLLISGILLYNVL